MRAAIYVCVISQAERQDVQHQLAQLRQYAASQNWEITVEYVSHQSGSRADRLAILGTNAKQEPAGVREHVCARLIRARARATRSGRPVGRPPAIFNRDEAIEARRAGLSWRQIARKLGVSATTIRRACRGVSSV